MPAVAVGSISETSVPLRATPLTKKWVSEQKFEPSDVVVVGVVVRGEVLGNADLGCDIYYAGRGIAVRVNLCGKTAAPMRVHYSSLNGHAVPFRLTYRLE